MAAMASPVFHFELRRLLTEVTEDAAVLESPNLSYFKEFLTHWVEQQQQQHDTISAATSPPLGEETTPHTHTVPAAAHSGTQEHDEAALDADDGCVPADADPVRATPSTAPINDPQRAGEQGPVDLEVPRAATDDGALADTQARLAAAMSAGRYATACALCTACIEVVPSALMLARRAECHVRLRKPNAAVRDCDAALGLNPDSGKAYKIRGWAYRTLGQWDSALKDLITGQRIDYDESTHAMQQLVQARVEADRVERAEAAAKEEREQWERERGRREQREREQDEARQKEQQERKRRDSETTTKPTPKPIAIPPHLVRQISDDPDLRVRGLPTFRPG